jgi:hypothetical protein
MSLPAETEFGIKKLTPTNWRERDPATKHMSRFRADGSFSALAEEDWLESVLTIQLTERVPAKVRKLFAVARGAILYGYFFYPLVCTEIVIPFDSVTNPVSVGGDDCPDPPIAGSPCVYRLIRPGVDVVETAKDGR